ncbi:MAG: asparaginase [Balneolaceae bacterium]
MKKINLIQTGGTIAMQEGREGAGLDRERWLDLLNREIPELSGIAELTIDPLFFLDSSDLQSEHWSTLAGHIQNRSESFDGFVILHGTDTMAYTASALSFLLCGLMKPVIFTGSQVPMSQRRSDARRNLVNAVELATLPIPEVAICFNDQLFRGNRTTKMSIGDFDAFASPNHPPLAEVGVEITIANVIRPEGPPVELRPEFNDQIFLLKLHPNLDPVLLSALPMDQLRGVILEAFGSGNFPMKGKYNLLPYIQSCREAGVDVVITSQAPYDAVDLTLYESGRAALDLGAVSAGDMTTEAVITKSMILYGNGYRGDDFKDRFEMNLARERTN